MKEQIKTKNIIKGWKDSQLIRCRVQNTGNQDAHRNGGVYGCKIEEEVKTMQRETKKNIQGTNSEGKGTGTLINDLEQ